MCINFDNNQQFETKDLEVAVPLYISNFCDSNCSICNMRKSNHKLKRKELCRLQIQEQLDIIKNVENISSILILTGELNFGLKRRLLLEQVIFTITKALELGFEKITLNIGALTHSEIKDIYCTIGSDYHNVLGLSVFQETYNLELYKKYFHLDKQDIPKSHFTFRLNSCKRWLKNGFSRVNVGILLGLGDTENDLISLCNHYQELIKLGGIVEISLPRIIAQESLFEPISDNEFIDIVKYISKTCKKAKIILTTRESEEVISKVIEYIDVISPGTSDVGAYTYEGYITNNPETSQFYVSHKRKRPSWILDNLMQNISISNIKYYNKLQI